MRSPSQNKNPAPEGSIDLEAAQAARAQIRQAGKDRERAEVVEILSAAHFGWAADGRRTIPRDLCIRISEHEHVTPMLAAYVVQAVDDAGRAHAARGGPALNPLGMVIARTGTQQPRPGQKPRRADDVPMWFAKHWESRVERKAQLINAQQRLDALRNTKPAAINNAAAGGS